MEGKGLEAFESFKAWDRAACIYWRDPGALWVSLGGLALWENLSGSQKEF